MREYDNSQLKEVVDLAKKKGYKVYTFNANGPIKQVYFVNESGQIGSAQAYFSGINFTSIHKPSRECGTGFRIGKEFEYPENLDIAFSSIPEWGGQYLKFVKKYKNWEEYTGKNSPLTWAEL